MTNSWDYDLKQVGGNKIYCLRGMDGKLQWGGNTLLRTSISKTKREEAGQSQEMWKVEDIGAEQRCYKTRFMTVIFQGKCNRIAMSPQGVHYLNQCSRLDHKTGSSMHVSFSAIIFNFPTTDRRVRRNLVEVQPS